MKVRSAPRFTLLLAVSTLVSSLAALSPDCRAGTSREATAAAERGLASYLAGHYDQALPDLEKARDGGAATGVHLYMIGYCYEAVKNDREGSKKVYEIAKDKLESEIKGRKPPLESYFYLSNLYQNLGDRDRSQKLAKEALAAIAAKKLKVGKDGTSLFRVGKLHADSGDSDHAIDWYRKAIEAFSKEKDPPPAYLQRSLDPVARADLGKGDPAAVADMWEKLVKLDPHVANGDWSLGMAAVRAGRWTVAKSAFHKLREPVSDRSQDAFYAEMLADGAEKLVKAGYTIPTKGPDGQAIATLTGDTLGEKIKELSKSSGELLGRELKAGEYEILPPVNEKAKPRLVPGEALVKQIAEAHREFVALLAEQLLRTGALQEEAFTAGYAPLVIQDWLSLWRTNHMALIEEAIKAKSSKAGEGGS